VAMYKLLRGQLKFLKNDFDVVGLCSREKYFDELAEREGIRMIAVEIRRGISLWKDFISVLKLVRVFKQEKPLIIHSHTGKAGFIAMIAGKIAGVPIRIQTVTGVGYEATKGIFRQIIILSDRITFFCATNIIPEGNGVRNSMLKFNVTKKPLHIIRNGNINGIDIDYFNPSTVSDATKSALKNSLCIKESDFVYVFIGRIVGDKGVNELVSSFDMLFKSYQDIKLLLVGPFENTRDPLSEDTKHLIKENKAIVPVGLQQDIRPYLAISDILVLPSYREGFPNAVLEAGSMGIPAIVTDINGCNEIIKHEFNGLIINTKDVVALTKAMERVYLNRDFLKQLACNIRPVIVERYRREDVWEALLEEYKLLIKNYNTKWN